MKKYWWLVIAILFATVFYLRTLDLSINYQEEKPNVDYALQDQGNIQLFFCPRENCEQAFVEFLNSAQKSIHCALYEINLPSVQQTLLEKQKVMDVKVVTDDDYFHEFNYSFVKKDSYGLMHNKFCIIDGVKFSSGSMNPTDNCAHKNNNNLLLVNSKVLAQNYEDEFQEMWNGTFKKGNPVQNPVVKLGNITIKNYFCPEDHCAQRVEDELKKAQQSIYFMTFSFTHDGIGNILLLKNLENISMKGVMETTQVTKDSEFLRLSQAGITVLKDGNKHNMHHKVFVIDQETVVTGSFNPTGGGDKSNDENVLIIRDPVLAKRYLEEFQYVWKEAVNKTGNESTSAFIFD